MPKLTFDILGQNLEGAQESVVHVVPHGFIDSSSCRYFERALDNAYKREARFAVLDLSDVHYINSTGISLIIRHFGLYKERKGLFVLASVPRSVGLSMHLLGVTSLIPFHKDITAANTQFKQVIDGSFQYSDTVKNLEPDLKDATTKKKKIYIPVRKHKSPLENSKIMLITPEPSRFSRVLRLRFSYLNGNFKIIHDINQALSSVDQIKPDLVVLDDRMDPGGDFVRKLKLHPERSLISLIKIYTKETEIDRDLEFKIWENDYLIDPFEILELFSLSEAELLRVPKDRKVFQQQVRLEFRSTKENIEKAIQLCDFVIRSALDNEEDRTAMYAAIKEGMDNAVIHGNAWDKDRTIDINFLVDRSKLTVIIEDEGDGFDFEYYLARIDDQETFELAKKKILEQGKRGGLGILLMHRCSDRIEYSGNGNILRLEKNRS